MLLDLMLHSAPAVLVSIGVALVLTLAFARIQQNRKIKALGGRAKVLPTKCFGTFKPMPHASACTLVDELRNG